MIKRFRTITGLTTIVAALALSMGAYAFTASNTIADGSQSGVGSATISGYAVSNVDFTLDSTNADKWSEVKFNLDADAAQVYVQLTGGTTPMTTWASCSATTISPWLSTCTLSTPVDSSNTTIKVSAAK